MKLEPQARRNLWVYSACTAISRFGGQYQFLAVTALTYAVTGSAFATALQMAVSSIPAILLARWSGLLADRHDPRKVVAAVSVLQAALTLLYIGTRNVGLILGLNFLVSSAAVFLRPARAALMPELVGKSALMEANARMATINGVVQLLAPGLAGSLLVRTGADTAFIVNAASYLFPAVAMWFVRPVQTRTVAARGRERFGLADVWTFLRGQPDILLLLAVYGGYSLGMWSVNALFFPYAKEVLHASAEVVGWSISAYFGAYTVTGLVMERWGRLFHNVRWLLAGSFIGAAVWAGYALTRSVPIALVLSAFDGVIFTYAVTLFETSIQERAPDATRGRIFGFVGAYDELCTVSGQLMGGALVGWLGVLKSIWLSAGLTVVLVAAAGCQPRLRGARMREHVSEQEM